MIENVHVHFGVDWIEALFLDFPFWGVSIINFLFAGFCFDITDLVPPIFEDSSSSSIVNSRLLFGTNTFSSKFIFMLLFSSYYSFSFPPLSKYSLLNSSRHIILRFHTMDRSLMDFLKIRAWDGMLFYYGVTSPFTKNLVIKSSQKL